MTIQTWAVITPTQRTLLMSYNNNEVSVNPRYIDNPNPGIGINLNPDSADFDGGDVLSLSGNYLAPKRIVDDQDYITYAPDMVAMILTLPWAILDSETVFAPEEVD